MIDNPNATNIKFYFDEKCTRPLKKVEWDGGFRVTFDSGTEELIKNVAVAGQEATATFYVRNESNFRFGIRTISHPDDRVKIIVDAVDHDWLYPHEPIKVTFSVKVSPEPTKKDIVESANFVITGFFVID